jgi:FlaA1/EpsC-like NDP-sugar epimerase
VDTARELPCLCIVSVVFLIRNIAVAQFTSKMSFLELEGLHVFVTGAAGGIGGAIVDEFLGR